MHLHPRAAMRRDGHVSRVFGLALRGVRARSRRDGLVSVVLVTAVLAEPPRRCRAASGRRLDADAVGDVVRGRTRREVACGVGGGAQRRQEREQARSGGAFGPEAGSRRWKGMVGRGGGSRRRDAPIPLLPEARAIMSLQKTRATCSRVEEPNPKDATVSSLLEDCWPSTPLSSYEPGPGDSAAS